MKQERKTKRSAEVKARRAKAIAESGEPVAGLGSMPKAPEKKQRRLQVSVHTLMLARDCRARLVLRLANMRDVGEPQPGSFLSMLCGTWGHKAMAAWLSDQDWHEAILPYEDITEELLIREDRRGYSNLYKIIETVTDRYPVNLLPFDRIDPKTTEIGFVSPLGEIDDHGTPLPVDMIGYIDKIVTSKRTGMRLPLEHKFTGKLDASFVGRFTEYDPQVTAYMLAYETVTGERCNDAMVNAIETSMVPSSDRKCPKHGVMYAECGPEHVKQTFIDAHRTPAQLDEFKKLALEIAAKYVLPAARVAEKYGARGAITAPRDGMFTDACAYCEFRRWCLTANRGPNLLDTYLAQNVYEDNRLRSGFVYV